MPSDKIRLDGMAFYGYHGVRPAEREFGQRFLVDLEVTRDLTRAGESDDLKDTVSYSELFDLVKDIGETTNVIEKHAEVVTRLQALAEKARADLGDSGTKRTGAGVRPPGRLKNQKKKTN